MDQAIAKHLRKRGVYDTRHLRDTELPFSERNRRFFEWFHQSVMGFDTEEYRKKFWREAYRTGRTIGDVPYTLDDYLRRRGAAYRQDLTNLLYYALLLGGCFAAWVIRRQIDKHIRRLKRPGYYERELTRRKELAAERRKLKERRTVSPRPTEMELRIAFRCANDSPAAMIRFGSLLEDLECYVDNSAIFDVEGNLVGRRGGIRQYFRDKMPDLSARYKTVMRYKALARKFRQAFGVADPIPAAALLPTNGKANTCTENALSTKSAGKSGVREFASVTIPLEVVEGAGRLLGDCENSFVSVAAALEVRIGPDYTPKIDPNTIANDNVATRPGTFARTHGTARRHAMAKTG